MSTKIKLQKKPNAKLVIFPTSACQLYDQMKRSFLRSGPPKPVEFVTNGELAYEGELPFMVALGYPDSENPSSLKYVCGGGLITPKHVLTAAHCVDNFNGDVPVQVNK